MMRSKTLFMGLAAILLSMSIAPTVSAHTSGQHGSFSGHLLGPGAWGNIQFVGKVRVQDAEEGLIADVGVFGNYAYLARWGGSQCAGPERRGQQLPDGGVYVIDISDLSNPREVGFIPTQQDTLVGEGVQVIRVDTPKFTGDVLVINHEGCGKNYKAGFSLWDVTNPLAPKKLKEHFGDFTANGQNNTPHDANQTHSAFAWDAGDRAYLISVDDEEAEDVDVFEITDPKKPALIGEYDLNVLNISQPEIGLTNSFLHDMVVKQIGGQFLALLSYWDGGYVILNVTNPLAPQFLGDSEFTNPDPELLAQTGVALRPEGNAHQAEFTADNRFVIATDEDFDPFGLAVATSVGTFPANLGTNTTAGDVSGLTGVTVFVGRACPGDPAVPAATGPGQIAVVERGLCLFTEKATSVINAGGYEAMIIMNREGADACVGTLTPSLEGAIRTIFIGRDAGFALFSAPYDQAQCEDATQQLAPIAIGATGGTINSIAAVFNGWGYVHLFGVNIGMSSATLTELDTFAIPEAMNPTFATGFGDLSVHEVATDQTDASRAYLSYYKGGIRSMQIQCANPSVLSTCDLVEVGGYLDPAGNDFWGVEVQVRNGQTYIFGSDRDSGLWIFRRT